MNVWLFTWEGTTSSITDANKVVGVLSARNSESEIEKFVDFVYHRTIFTVGEMAHYANKRKARQSRSKSLFSRGGRIFYGSNPFLFARLVKDFAVIVDSSRNTETVSWVELAVIENNESTGYAFAETVPEKPMSVSRPAHKPLAIEPSNA